MKFRATLIERSFQLAASGRHATLQDVCAELHTEGFTHVSEGLAGPSLRAQLKGLIARSQLQPAG